MNTLTRVYVKRMTKQELQDWVTSIDDPIERKQSKTVPEESYWAQGIACVFISAMLFVMYGIRYWNWFNW